MKLHRLATLGLVAAALAGCGGRSELGPMPGQNVSGADARGDLTPGPDRAGPARDTRADRGGDVPATAGDAPSDGGPASPIAVVGIELAPAAVTIAAAVPFDGFVVTARYADGSTKDVTAEATFGSADPGIAQPSGSTVTGKQAGVTIIKAQHDGHAASARVTVTAAPLLAIDLTGVAPIPVGQSIAVLAMGVFTDGSKQDITAAAAWAVTDGGLAAVSFDPSTRKARITGLRAGKGELTATLDGVTAKAALTVTSAVMNRIELAPTQPLMQQGRVARLGATAIYSDGTASDVTMQAIWSSSDEATLRVRVDAAGPMVTAVGPGAATITATMGAGADAMVGSTTVTVTSPTLVAIALSSSGIEWPIVGRSAVFSASGTYSDGSSGDVTLAATWSSSDGTIASVSNASGSKGVVMPLAVGSATISATLAGLSASIRLSALDAPLVRIDVSVEPAAVGLGLTARMVATGTFEDRTERDLTGDASWTVSEPDIVVVSNAPGSAGQVTGVGVGSTTVIASYGTLRGRATVTVTKARPTSLSLSPARATVTAGGKTSFQAIGKLDDGSTHDLSSHVTWFSSAPSVARVSNAADTRGLATSLTAGSATITATLGDLSATASLTVGDPLLASLLVSPAAASIRMGDTEAFIATAVYGNGSTIAVEAAWRSSDPGVATVEGQGRGIATGVATGTTIITATYQDQTASARLTVRGD